MYSFGRSSLTWILKHIDGWFNRVYGSRYNPLYRSGTLAVLLLTVVIVTGFYLVFVYRLASPYESMVDIQNQIFFGRWIRALHRYASDAAVVALAFHVIRMVAEGKTWGPRFLAWITGVFLALLMFVVSWTGFILIWDMNAQALAIAGAKMISQFPLFSNAIMRSLSGATQVGTSFYFLNLFLHMALPLGMVFGLWLHTSRLREPAWFPSRPIMFVTVGGLILLSLLIPVPLAEKANLLRTDGELHLNWFYNFLIPMVHQFGPRASLLFWGMGFLALIFVPTYFRPRREAQPIKSVHNQAACTGCAQCYQDCPFDAIEMIPRTQGKGSEVVASVLEAYCVGCGICSASCSQLAIGPPDLSAQLQLQKIRRLKTEFPHGGILFIYCGAQAQAEDVFDVCRRDHPGLVPLRVECAGNLHAAAVAYALGQFPGVFIFGCAPEACTNRVGSTLMEQRMLHGREPQVPKGFDSSKVSVFLGSGAEINRMCAQLEEFSKKFGSPRAKSCVVSSMLRRAVASLITAVLLAGIGSLSSLPYRMVATSSVLRMAIRLPGQVIENCRTRTAEELAKMSAHMRSSQDCQRQSIDYEATVKIDGEIRLRQTVTAAGARSDRPLILEHDLELPGGPHQIEVEFVPEEGAPAEALSLNASFNESFEAGRIWLVTYDSNTHTLSYSKTAVP